MLDNAGQNGREKTQSPPERAHRGQTIFGVKADASDDRRIWELFQELVREVSGATISSREEMVLV